MARIQLEIEIFILHTLYTIQYLSGAPEYQLWELERAINSLRRRRKNG